MAQAQSKSSSFNEPCRALPSLPMRLREIGRLVAADAVNTFVLGDVSAKRRLEETEARLAAMSQYFTEKG